MSKKITRLGEQESREFWIDKKVVVTGGAGFLGSHLVQKLEGLGPQEIFVPRSREYDLRGYEACQKAFQGRDLVIHLASNVGGIGYNQEHPAELFDDNILMGVNALRAALAVGIKKFVAIGTICSYPKYATVPFKEEDLWTGYPEETNAPYGLAKLMLLVQSQAYREQYNFKSIFLLPVNLYGPGDNFNPESSHVIPAMMRKFVKAKEDGTSQVTVWGTGKATREFLYVKDAAEGILLAAEKYDKAEPVNLGAGFEISIRNLADKIKKLVGFNGEVVWDASKPDGQPRRMLETSRAKREFGFVAKTDFEDGLKETLNWYLKNRPY